MSTEKRTENVHLSVFLKMHEVNRYNREAEEVARSEGK